MKILLKKHSLFRAAIYSLLLLCSNLNAHYLPGDWQPAPQLGNGYNSITHEVTSCNCVDAPCINSLEGHTKSVYALSFSPSEAILASGSEDKTIKLWNITTGILLRTFEGHKNSVNSVSFSPDGATLASGSSDKTVKLWDVKTGTFLRTLEGHNDYVGHASFSHDGTILASGSADKTIKLWNSETGNLIRTFEEGGYCVLSISFSKDNPMLASCSWDANIKVWNVNTATLLHTIVGLSCANQEDSEIIFNGGVKIDNSNNFWKNLCFDSILHHAIRGKNSKVVKMIAEKFPLLVFIRTQQGQSPLELAKELQHTHSDGPAIVELLKSSNGA